MVQLPTHGMITPFSSNSMNPWKPMFNSARKYVIHIRGCMTIQNKNHTLRVTANMPIHTHMYVYTPLCSVSAASCLLLARRNLMDEYPIMCRKMRCTYSMKHPKSLRLKSHS
ncbi:hypothetical protein EON65_46805 [archaeon]|nr:MAG: hypothetical protein EON65_46805 [archaeon]